MKKRDVSFFIFFFFYQTINGQSLPDANAIFSVQPKWHYVSEDTNWYRVQLESNPHLDQFFGTFHQNSMVKGDDYYLLEEINGQTHSPPLSEGYLLHKIDLKTGEPLWIHFDNFFSGNEFVETVFGGNMHFNQDGDIAVNGFKSLDSIKNIVVDGFDSRVYVNVMQDVIDDSDGSVKEQRVDLDTSRTIEKLHPGGFLIRRVGNNRQVKHIFENVFEDGFVQNYLHFYDIDETGKVSDHPIFSYKHTTTIDVDIPFFSYPNLYYQINENSGVGLFGTVDQTQGNIPSELKLVFFDTSNSPDIFVTEVRDILDLLPDNIDRASSAVFVRGKDEHFFVAQKAKVSLDSMTFEDFIWMEWFNDRGESIQRIERLQIDGLDMDFLSDYTFMNNTMYLLCEKNDGGPTGERLYYFIESNEDVSLHKLSSFVKPVAFDGYSISFSGMRILENKDVVLYANINYPYEGDDFYKKNASFLFRFASEDFGLITNVKDISSQKISIFPNPVQNYLRLNNMGDNEINAIEIFNITGLNYPLENIVDNELYVGHLQAGCYYLRLVSNSIVETIPFIKF